MSFLNYHHLRYFQAIAQDGKLTRAAEKLRISPSALSIQLRQLEESLGQKLFERANKKLTLTEAGRIALEYTETIFHTGEELYDTLKHRAPKQRQIVRIGAVATLSRNFQINLIKPILNRKDLELILRIGLLSDLLGMLETHTIDLVLSNMPIPHDARIGLQSHLIEEQEVILVSPQSHKKFTFPYSLDRVSMVLPSAESNIRRSFDLLMHHHRIKPFIISEVDDMAMLRLLARETDAITLVPRVVVRDELKNGDLIELHRIAQIRESFYAITPSRHFPNTSVRELLNLSKDLKKSKRNKKSSPSA